MFSADFIKAGNSEIGDSSLASADDETLAKYDQVLSSLCYRVNSIFSWAGKFCLVHGLR